MGDAPPTRRRKGSFGENTDPDYHALMVEQQNAGMRSKDTLGLRFDALGDQVRDGAYPLHMAILAGAPVHVVTLLLQGAPDMVLTTNKYGETPLHVALQRHASDDVIAVLVSAEKYALEFREHRHGNLPIHVAATVGCSMRVAKELLAVWPGAIHEKNQDNLTPLELALRHGRCSPDVLQVLAISDRVEDE
jgi:hypothetical protein